MNWFIDMELSRIHREELLKGSEDVNATRSWDSVPRRPWRGLTLQGLKLHRAEARTRTAVEAEKGMAS